MSEYYKYWSMVMDVPENGKDFSEYLSEDGFFEKYDLVTIFNIPNDKIMLVWKRL